MGHVIKNNLLLTNFHKSNLKKCSLGRPEILRINLVSYLKIEIKTKGSDVIKKQMGHLPEGKVNQAYDHSQRLPERKQFLTQWGKELINIGLTL